MTQHSALSTQHFPLLIEPELVTIPAGDHDADGRLPRFHHADLDGARLGAEKLKC